MSVYEIRAIDPDELMAVRAAGADRQNHRVVAHVDERGGAQLRCCLRRSETNEAVLVISHAPLQTDTPWREAGPVFVHADPCSGRADSPDVPDWIEHGPRVLRAHTPSGGMHYPANRIVDADEGVAAALAEMFLDQMVAEVHVRNLLEQCFIVRAVRTP